LVVLDKNIKKGGDNVVPEDDRIWCNITDLFTTDEIDRAMTLFLECKNTKEDFTTRCTKDVVERVIHRVNAHTGNNNSAAALVYRLEMYLRSVMREERESITEYGVVAGRSELSEISVFHDGCWCVV
jgi:hypothetical protein